MGTSFVQDFGSKIMGLWPGCTEGGTDFSCRIHFNIKDYPPRTNTISMASLIQITKLNINIMRNI